MALVDLTRQQPASWYTCGNCGRVIAQHEQPYQWGEAVVCPGCCVALQAQMIEQAPASVYIQVVPQTPRRGPSQQNLALVGLILAFVFPLAGLIVSCVASNAMRRVRNYEGQSLATAGKVLSAIFLILGVFGAVAWFVLLVHLQQTFH